MLLIQGQRGADVLAYSESLESVSFTSTSTEVLRGLGYWLFYIRDVFGATTTASLDYLASVRVMVVRRRPARRGAVRPGVDHLAASPLRRPADRSGHRARRRRPPDRRSVSADVGLRSATARAGWRWHCAAVRGRVPVLVLGLALSAASLVAACGSIRLPSRRARPANRGHGARSCHRGRRARGRQPPVAAQRRVRRSGARTRPGSTAGVARRRRAPRRAARDGYRVLQLPGSEFGAFRWGYTVDQPLPALTERPLVTRDLLPLGSAAAMDLVFALDDRFQDGVVDVAAIAPIARLLGVDTIWVADDVAFDRFRLARPRSSTICSRVTRRGGRRPAAGRAVRRAGPERGTDRRRSTSSPSATRAWVHRSPTVSLVGVDSPVATIRAKDDVGGACRAVATGSSTPPPPA